MKVWQQFSFLFAAILMVIFIPIILLYPAATHIVRVEMAMLDDPYENGDILNVVCVSKNGGVHFNGALVSLSMVASQGQN